MKHITASTHTGGGLWEIGAMMAGYTPAWGIEIRPDIAAVARRNIPGLQMVISDVASVNYSTLRRVYHLHSSPSCKNASIANKDGEEALEDIESALAICAALRALGPVTFTLENVWQYRGFDSFRLILYTLSELGYCAKYWRLCAADYGVPQERYRLILIARRDREPRKPEATHYKPDAKKAVMGMRSMFWQPWVGWLEAIQDLVGDLPESEFAPWQLARLPKELKSMLLAQGGYDGQIVNREVDEPAFTVTRALLIPGGGNTNFAEASPGRGCRYGDEPSTTVTTVTGAGGSMPKAFIIPGDNTSNNTVRQADEPMVTIQSRSLGQCPHRAFLVNKSADKYGDGIVYSENPAFTVVSNSQGRYKAFVGRVVKMMPRCLARLQSIPDEYELPESNSLACEIIGNSVPPLLAKAVMESLK